MDQADQRSRLTASDSKQCKSQHNTDLVLHQDTWLIASRFNPTLSLWELIWWYQSDSYEIDKHTSSFV